MIFEVAINLTRSDHAACIGGQHFGKSIASIDALRIIREREETEDRIAGRGRGHSESDGRTTGLQRVEEKAGRARAVSAALLDRRHSKTLLLRRVDARAFDRDEIENVRPF